MIEPRPYQQDAVNSLFDYYSVGNQGNPVVAMPTASGKSIVIAKFCHIVLSNWPRQRIIVATHVKELIEQNFKKMLEAWPEAPAGIYSAGLNKRETIMPIIFGGVQSMVNCAEQFGWRDLLLVDEAHLISGKDDSNYGNLITALRKVNPNLKVIGLSATPWRTGQGRISDGPIFTDICFDLTSMAAFNKLIEDGYLCTLIPKRTTTELHYEDVGIQNGDYKKDELQTAVNKDAVTHSACREIIEQGFDRNSWLIFASGIEHADNIAKMMHSFGIDAVSVHSKISDEKRDKAIKDFKSGKLRCVVNNNVLTTGFDHPGLDLIGMLRPTVSTVLWVQMLGRGTRPAPGKANCLVLDFAGNTKRLGPINDPVIPKKRGEKGGGVAPIRICEECGTYNHARAVICINCGHKFANDPKITKFAGTDALIKTGEAPIVQMFDVQRVIYHRHQKGESTPVMQVSYFCGLRMFNEYICLEHSGFAGKKARDWWRQRILGEPPKTVDEALKYVAQLKVPNQIRVWLNKKYPEVMATIF